MNINIVHDGKRKWLPCELELKERGLSERPWVPMFSRKVGEEEQEQRSRVGAVSVFQLSSKKEFQKA